jgi:hypothetical protein
VYLPATFAGLRALRDAGRLGGGPLTAFAVTPALREWYGDDDEEELEYAALLDAARASLRLLDADPGAPRRRVVIALDAEDRAVTIRDDLDRGVVRLADPVTPEQIAALHVDDPEAADTVAAAAAAVTTADLGDDAAQDTVDDAEGFPLSWYAPQELDAVLEDG